MRPLGSCKPRDERGESARWKTSAAETRRRNAKNICCHHRVNTINSCRLFYISLKVRVFAIVSLDFSLCEMDKFVRTTWQSRKRRIILKITNWWLHSGLARWRVRIDACWVIKTRRRLGELKQNKNKQNEHFLRFDCFCIVRAQFSLTSLVFCTSSRSIAA
jgi:hypothetical protein